VTSSGIQTATFRLVARCLNLPCYGVVNCIRGKEISCLLYNRNVPYRVHSGLPLPSVLLSMSADHILTSHTLRPISILSSHLRILPPSDIFASGIPAKRLWAHLLSVMRATFSVHLVLDTTKCLDPTSLRNDFMHFSMTNCGYIFDQQNRLRRLAFRK
jgi:hypothetical protein